MYVTMGQILKCSAEVLHTFLILGKIHPITEIIDRSLSSSKVVSFLSIVICIKIEFIVF